MCMHAVACIPVTGCPYNTYCQTAGNQDTKQESTLLAKTEQHLERGKFIECMLAANHCDDSDDIGERFKVYSRTC